MNSRFGGKTVLITGASSGIGLATAKLFAEEGATVFMTGRRADELDRAASEVGKNAVPVQGDITKGADLDRLFARIGQSAGTLDILIANAGSGEFVPLGAYTEEHLDRTFAVNVKGTAFTVQKALPLLPPHAAIVVMGSITSVQGTPAFGAYAASKAALRSFVRTWSAELKDRHIRVNMVSPGIVPTPAYDALGLTATVLEPSIGKIPLGRLGTTTEIAKAIAFLASSDSDYVAGAELFVDGGLTQV